MRAGGALSIPLNRQPDAMAAIEAAVASRGGSMRMACIRAGVSRNSYYAWRSAAREPSAPKLADLAAQAGLEIVMVGHGRTVALTNFAGVMAALDHHRRRMRLSIMAIEARSGIANRSYSYWLTGLRQPAVLTLSTLAETLGFSLLMRRRTDPNDPRVIALADASATLSERVATFSALAWSIRMAIASS